MPGFKVETAADIRALPLKALNLSSPERCTPSEHSRESLGGSEVHISALFHTLWSFFQVHPHLRTSKLKK